MSTVNEKMTALADAIRAKTGGTEPLTIDGMTAAVESIESGGSSGGGTSIDTCTVTINGNGATIPNWIASIYDNGNISYAVNSVTTDTNITIPNVICGSILTCNFGSNGGYQTDKAQWIKGTSFQITAAKGETATISFISF